MKFKVGCLTDIGRKKANNEDNYFFLDDAGLFLVADGMGGHAGGEVASALAVGIIREKFEEWMKNGSKSGEEASLIEESIKCASTRIKEVAAEKPELTGMGTTVVLCLFTGEKVFISNVGDSRCYRFRDNALALLSHDQSQIQEYIDMNLITEEQAKTHPMRHVITQAVGYNDDLKVRTVEEKYSAGEYFLLCSDGLNDHFESDAELNEVFSGYLGECRGAGPEGEDLTSVCRRLIDFVNERGGRDNTTVMIVKTI